MKKLLLLFILLLVLAACSGRENFTFQTMKGAEESIGDIQTPDMPEGYKIQKITYLNDGFTHPVTKVFYQNGKHNVTFMTASSRFDDRPSQKVENSKIADLVWISKGKEYVLKWRQSDKHSYKYLFSKKEKDKEWFISIAESYSGRVAAFGKD
ncbi:hypothetical protein [Halobacillus litoralis]|uniref:hypothetical protein n=1 Tax=Halobacillus litoralis TaxID=45668 RepID=UPI001CFCF16F|nr:hypothetical protein [Halobacillus litoralis]